MVVGPGDKREGILSHFSSSSFLALDFGENAFCTHICNWTLGVVQCLKSNVTCRSNCKIGSPVLGKAEGNYLKETRISLSVHRISQEANSARSSGSANGDVAMRNRPS